MGIIDKVNEAIKLASEGFKTSYIRVGDKTIRVSDHGANPKRTDYNCISLVVGNDNQSFRSDRGRMVTNWERANQWYVNTDGDFYEQFDSIESFLSWFEIEEEA